MLCQVPLSSPHEPSPRRACAQDAWEETHHAASSPHGLMEAGRCEMAIPQTGFLLCFLRSCVVRCFLDLFLRAVSGAWNWTSSSVRNARNCPRLLGIRPCDVLKKQMPPRTTVLLRGTTRPLPSRSSGFLGFLCPLVVERPSISGHLLLRWDCLGYVGREGGPGTRARQQALGCEAKTGRRGVSCVACPRPSFSLLSSFPSEFPWCSSRDAGPILPRSTYFSGPGTRGSSRI